MPIGQGIHPIVQNVSLVVECRKAYLGHFDRVQNMICRLEHAKLGLGAGCRITEYIKKALMLDVLFHVIFLDSLGFFL